MPLERPACDRLALSPQDRTRHFDDIVPALSAIKTAIRELPDGYAFRFPGDAKTSALLAEWTEREHQCCTFLHIDLRREGEGQWLTLTGAPGTKRIIAAELGEWLA